MQAQIMGYILIILCPAAGGWLMSLQIREELRRLEGVIELIRHIKYEICQRLCPQQDIFVRFENPALEKCGFLTVLKSCGVEGEKSVLRVALDSYGRLFESNADCERALLDFSDTLGKLERTVQAQKCDYYIAYLSDILDKSRTRAGADMKLCRSMGMLAGVVTALVLI